MTEVEAIIEAYDKGRELGRSELKNEVDRLRAVLIKIATEPKPRTPDDLREMAREALDETSIRHRD